MTGKMNESSFSILNFFRSLIIKSDSTHIYRIGIGLSEDRTRSLQILQIFDKMFQITSFNSISQKVQLIFYAYPSSLLDSDIEEYTKIHSMCFHKTLTPESDLMFDLEKKNIDAIIRGSISANKLLSAIKHAYYSTESIALFRLAILETATDNQFFFAPVGIDEAETIEMKVKFIKYSIDFFQKIELDTKINILGEGRIGDKGRSVILDEKLENTMKFLELTKSLIHLPNSTKNTNDGYQNIEYKEILIENAIENRSCMVFAPDGISGNLIYRTLIHLGAGKSYGALYLREYLEKNRVIIDTSRVAPDFELTGALIFAIGLLAKKHEVANSTQ